MLKKTRVSIILLALLGSYANAELVIDVQGVAQPTPVAIVPFGWEGNCAGDAARCGRGHHQLT